jgi:hypothetical protein
VTYTLGTIGALLVLNIAIPWLLVSNLAMLAIVHHAACERRGLLRNWALAQVVILLLWVPALIAMWLANRGAVLSGESEEEPTADEVLEGLKKQRLKLKDDIATQLRKLERRM